MCGRGVVQDEQSVQSRGKKRMEVDQWVQTLNLGLGVRFGVRTRASLPSSIEVCLHQAKVPLWELILPKPLHGLIKEELLFYPSIQHKKLF